ncbi:hypothetical protein PSPO01_04814 [Paraphaeosphaeria sporulosa]
MVGEGASSASNEHSDSDASKNDELLACASAPLHLGDIYFRYTIPLVCCCWMLPLWNRDERASMGRGILRFVYNVE